MQVVVTGGTGVIGFPLVKKLVSEGHEVHYTHLSNPIGIEGAKGNKLDISLFEDVKSYFESVKPELVIHTAALTKVDLCETDRKLADKINVLGTENIVDCSKSFGAKIVFVSTSAVFDGSRDIYTEDDQTNPQYYYATTKLKGEDIAKDSGLPFLILRTDQPYCKPQKWQHENSVIRVIRNLKSGEVMKDVVDWYNTPTLVENFVEVASALIGKNKTGIYHVVGSDYINRYEMAIKTAEVFGLEKKLIRPIKSSELKLPAKRVNVHLDNKKAQQDSGIRLLGFTEGLKEMRSSMF